MADELISGADSFESAEPFESRVVDLGSLRLAARMAGTGKPLVLIHGFPQTSFQWRSVVPALAAQHLVIAPDYRGAGGSGKPTTGYDKATMASDILALVDRVADPEQHFDVVGHDMGAFVAFALATTAAHRVDTLTLLDAPVLGTTAWDALRVHPRTWHIGFHSAVDTAVALVTGRERDYLGQFFSARAMRPDRVLLDLDAYTQWYSAPGALRAAFSAYAALEADAERNRSILADGPLALPLLVMAGELSNSGRALQPMTHQVSQNGTFVEVEGAGHWIVEEQPEIFLEHLAAFLDLNGGVVIG